MDIVAEAVLAWNFEDFRVMFHVDPKLIQLKYNIGTEKLAPPQLLLLLGFAKLCAREKKKAGLQKNAFEKPRKLVEAMISELFLGGAKFNTADGYEAEIIRDQYRQHNISDIDDVAKYIHEMAPYYDEQYRTPKSIEAPEPFFPSLRDILSNYAREKAGTIKEGIDAYTDHKRLLRKNAFLRDAHVKHNRIDEEAIEAIEAIEANDPDQKRQNRKADYSRKVKFVPIGISVLSSPHKKGPFT